MRHVIGFCVIFFFVTVLAEYYDVPSSTIDISLYQVYPRSFKDSDGDGVGDLKGVQSKLDHFIESNVDAFWLSPIYPSPMSDFGYDISNFTDIEPTFGTLQDFEELLKAAHDKSLKVILDLVPNHSSDQHVWFQKSLKNIEPYNDYYVWHKGRVLDNGTVVAPNNWVSVLGTGSAWSWREERQAYYLHQFSPEEPDFNFYNEKVIEEMKDIMRFWLRKGVDGFRVDSSGFLYEDKLYRDEPLSGKTNDPNNPDYTIKKYTTDQPESYDIVRVFRQVLDEFEQPKLLMMEDYTSLPAVMKYYHYGADFPFNFALIMQVNKNSNASDFKKVIDQWMSNMPAGATANWVAGNHDRRRMVSRLGYKRAQAVTLMTQLLPGVGVTYYGEEIGMEDTWISWEETQDPQGCSAGKSGFESTSRDPERTPFQWDNSTSAGFSTNPKTWLRVNENYKTLNLAAEKENKNSYYNFYQALSAVKKSPEFKQASLTTKLLNENVLAFSRVTKDKDALYAVMNFGHSTERVDLSEIDGVSDNLYLYYATDRTSLRTGNVLSNIKDVELSESGVMVFTTPGAKFITQ